MFKNFTETETWSVEDLVASLSENRVKKNKIEIPKFQRTLVWSKDQKKSFIDSIKKGYPIGAILLFKSSSLPDGTTVFSLIDGLQRSSTLNQYFKRPTLFFDKNNVDISALSPILNFIKAKNSSLLDDNIIDEIVEWIKNREGFEETKDFSSYIISSHIDSKLVLSLTKTEVDDLYKLFVPILKDIKTQSDISKFNIPILIYTGQKSNLPEIFERLNSKGTQLSKYQIYAASWTPYNTISISTREIIENIKKKYDLLIEEGYEVENYDGSPRNFFTSQFSYFEYLFGLGKHLCQKYEYLFKDTSKIEQEDSIGFNLVNICLGLQFSEMENLPERLQKTNLSQFESALIDATDIANNILKGYISLKMNKVKRIPINHSELQIVSIIGKIFHSKYNSDLTIKPNWGDVFEYLKANIPFHYLYDIIKDDWRGSGDSKAYNLISSDRYEKVISKKAWENIFDEWFNLELEKKEKTRVNISDKAILFYKYLYTYSLTAFEEISDITFDIEHLVPVDRLKTLVLTADGLPISAFPNLCLLDSALNRQKGSDTYYEYFDKQVQKGEETQAQADKEIDKIEKYTNTSIDLIKLNAVEKSADVLSTLTSSIVVFIIFAMFTLFVNIGAGLFIGKLLNEYYLGFLIVSTFYLVVGVLVYYNRHKLMKTPLSNMIIIKLINKIDLDEVLENNKYSNDESTDSNSKT